MKILFYGAGVMGSLYAARLKESGQDISVLARGQRLEDIREHGIALEDIGTGKRSTTRVNVVEGLDLEDAYDLVVVMMPKIHLPEILPVLAANRHTPNVLFMLNNAAGPGEMIDALGWERVLMGFPGAGGTRQGHVVRYMVVSGRQQPTTFACICTSTRMFYLLRMAALRFQGSDREDGLDGEVMMITINKDTCTACGICGDVCPRHIPETIVQNDEKITIKRKDLINV